ncbi:MAG: Acg family FMN-binding oxidoreductase [Actinomycetes bacterium]
MSTMTSAWTAQSLVHTMAEAARWAPSIHNTQPWRFTALEDGLLVAEDPARALPRLDPRGRLRTISCGAAVCNAEVALAAQGVQPHITLLPPEHPEALAVVRIGRAHHASREEQRLAEAVGVRRAHRRLHRTGGVAPDVLAELMTGRTGSSGPVRLTPADDAARHHLASLLVEALREQTADQALVEEVELWLRSRDARSASGDGIPVESLGTGPYPVDSLAHEHTDAAAISTDDVEELLSSSAVVAISTRGDTTGDWLAAGRALERLWLHVTALGLVLTFADQATQSPRTRPQLADVFDVLGHVQLVVRLGSPLVEVPATPRRPLEELIS